ncbi:MAG: glycoside hydrolase family 32 protein, partial [bacterium]|nr:glycoside hydrolase family 32 protein [bacterium]
TQFSVFWDGRIEKYVQYTRIKKGNEPQAAYYRERYDGYAGRTTDLHVGRAVSDDFLNWTEETTALAPDEVDSIGFPEGMTPMDFYGGNMSKYAEGPNAYIGLPNAYYHWEFDMTRKWWSGKYVQLPSTLDVQLVTSRDGITWNRAPGRKPFIRLGPEGTFWSKSLWPDGNAIRVGDELWFY